MNGFHLINRSLKTLFSISPPYTGTLVTHLHLHELRIDLGFFNKPSSPNFESLPGFLNYSFLKHCLFSKGISQESHHKLFSDSVDICDMLETAALRMLPDACFNERVHNS